jgi:hypothetical protein
MASAPETVEAATFAADLARHVRAAWAKAGRPLTLPTPQGEKVHPLLEAVLKAEQNLRLTIEARDKRKNVGRPPGSESAPDRASERPGLRRVK